MSNSKWDSFKSWLAAKVAEMLPESVKRFVLYDLHERASIKKGEDHDFWDVTFQELYDELRD